MKHHSLEIDNLAAGYDNTIIVDGVSLKIPSNKISVIIGANACGKSTLLKSVARLIKPMSGAISLDGKGIHSMNSKHLAQVMGLLPQSPVVPEGIAVSDLVSRGRYPYHSFLKGLTREDFDIVSDALESMGIGDIADRSVTELSGGQRQRVWIAMALAQQTDILLLDEPTTYLDITHQIEILDLLMDLNRKHGTTIVMVLHDINLSARYADHIIAMKRGKLIGQGAPKKIIDEKLIKHVFDLDCTVIEDPVSKTPFIVPMGKHHMA